MDAQSKLNRNYDNTAIYTSGFYANPSNNLDTHSKLFDAMKSLTMNQHDDTPFSLQIMLTNSEINIAPLGLIDLEELKEYENHQRQKYGLNYDRDAIPLEVKFIPHVEDEEIKKEIVGTTQELFADFNTQFSKIWHLVKEYLEENKKILDKIEADLIDDSHDVKNVYFEQFSKMSAAELKEKVGYEIEKTELSKFSLFMADMHEIQAIVLSAAQFISKEVMGNNAFIDVINDNVRRSTIFWVLDNTFYEIYFYVVNKYGLYNPKLVKYLKHHQDTLITNMRTDAYDRAKKMAASKKKVDFNKYFTDVFIPVAEQLLAKADEMKGLANDQD